MASSSKNTWVVILNAGAMGTSTDNNTREVTAERMEFDANSNRVVFYDGDSTVAFYQHALGVEPKSSASS